MRPKHVPTCFSSRVSAMQVLPSDASPRRVAAGIAMEVWPASRRFSASCDYLRMTCCSCVIGGQEQTARPDCLLVTRSLAGVQCGSYPSNHPQGPERGTEGSSSLAKATQAIVNDYGTATFGSALAPECRPVGPGEQLGWSSHRHGVLYTLSAHTDIRIREQQDLRIPDILP